ncbi:chaplin family protein [Spirillospora sp. NPDC048832]
MLAAGFVALGVTVLPANAFADVTSGDGGVLSGNQIEAPVSVPVDVSGNGVAVLGIGHATSHGGAKVDKRHAGGQKTSGAHGVASGNQLNAPISAPVNICGNSVAVIGKADAGCEGGAKVVGGGGRGGQATNGSGSVLGGNQLDAPISAPVNVCGNAVAVVGHAVAGCEGGAHVKGGGHAGGGQKTSGVFGVGSGNQGDIPISAPVDVCGNTAAVVGHAVAGCQGGAHVTGRPGGHQHTSGAGGVLAGNQAQAPTEIPADVCGNAAAIVGLSSAECQGGHGGYPNYPDYPDTPNYPHTPGYPDTPGYPGTPSLPDIFDTPGLPDIPGYPGDPGYGGYGGYPSAPRTPVPLPQTGLSDVASGLPALTDLPGQATLPTSDSRAGAPGLTDVVPVVNGLPGVNDLVQAPALPGATGYRTQGVAPIVDGLPPLEAPVGTLGLPGLAGSLTSMDLSKTVKSATVEPAGSRAAAAKPGLIDFVLGNNPLAVVNGIVKVNPLSLPVGQAAAAPQRAGAAPGAGLPGGLLQGQKLPVAISALDTQALSSTGNGLPGAVNAVNGLPKAVDAATGELGPVRSVAADGPILEDGAGSLWALGASAVLGAVAGVLALARRMLPGGRR